MDPHAVPFTDWSKTRKALSQQLRQTPDLMRLEFAMELLPQVIQLCGEHSRHRRMVLKIARALSVERPTIYAPCCPDYSHDGQRYNFRGLGSGVSLLAEKHLEFLAERVSPLLPRARIIFLIADQEADDPDLVTAAGISHAEFMRRIQLSLDALRVRTAAYGWEAGFMTEQIPGLREQEAMFAQALRSDQAKSARIQTETLARSPMYRMIRPNMAVPQMLERTIRTAAQYLIMGELAARQNALICNHTTTNLAWYGETGAALLHNPISVY